MGGTIWGGAGQEPKVFGVAEGARGRDIPRVCTAHTVSAGAGNKKAPWLLDIKPGFKKKQLKDQE